jgi:hypothetical protein
MSREVNGKMQHWDSTWRTIGSFSWGVVLELLKEAEAKIEAGDGIGAREVLARINDLLKGAHARQP